MSDVIESVTLKYISGRQIVLGEKEAVAVLNRNDFAAGRIVRFERKEPFLRMSKEGDKYIFETNEKIKTFNNLDELKKDIDCNTLWQVYCEEKH